MKSSPVISSKENKLQLKNYPIIGPFMGSIYSLFTINSRLKESAERSETSVNKSVALLSQLDERMKQIEEKGKELDKLLEESKSFRESRNTNKL